MNKSNDNVLKETDTNFKITSPKSLFGLSPTEEKLFVDWFNEKLGDTYLNNYTCVEHRLDIENIPEEFLGYYKPEGQGTFSSKQIGLKPNLLKILEDSNFTVNSYTKCYDSLNMSITWDSTLPKDSSTIKGKYSVKSGLIHAHSLKKVETDDDEGFAKEMNEILSPRNMSKLYSINTYDRVVRIRLNTIENKFIYKKLTCSRYSLSYDHILYPRYEKLLNENGWGISYESNNFDIHKKLDETAILVLKDRNQNEI